MKDTIWMLCHIAGHAKHGQSTVYDEATGNDVALVYDGDAHGKLIAAAPQLLAACRQAQSGEGDWRAALDEAIAAAK